MTGVAVSVSGDWNPQKFTNAVAKRCPDAMPWQTREDVAAKMVADAVATSRRTGLPVKTVAMKNLNRPRYFERAAKLSAAQHLEMVGRSADDASDDDWPTTIDTHLSMEETVGMRDLVARLPRRQRECVVLCTMHRHTHDEAAKVMGVSPATVRSHLEAGLAALRRAWIEAERV